MGRMTGKKASTIATNGKFPAPKSGNKSKVKEEPDVSMEDAESTGSESDVPLAHRRSTSNGRKKGTVNGQNTAVKKEEKIDSDDHSKVPGRRKIRVIVSDSENPSGSDSDVPLAKLKAKGPKSEDNTLNKSKSSSSLTKEQGDIKKAKRKRVDSSDSEYDDKNTATKNGSKKSIKKPITSQTKEDIKMKVSLSDEEDIPIFKRKGKTNGKKTTIIKEESEDSDSDVPLAKLKSGKGKVAENKSKTGTGKEIEVKLEKKLPVKAKRKRNDSDSEVDNKKQATNTASKNVASAKKPDTQRKKKKEDSPDESMSAKKRGKQKVKEEDSDNEEDEEFKWWNQQNDNNDGTDKWTTLEHNGVYFPPPYVPHKVKMKYDGKSITLEPEAEEVASFYAAMLGTDYVTNETFNRNFFKDWVKIIKKSKNNPPIRDFERDFEKCDFTPIYEYLEQEKERKKNMSKEEKAKLKEEKIKLEEKYGYCWLDGRKEKVGNFRIEPPGLFRGRGAHPKTGSLKFRVQPEQVTINIGKGAKIPSPPEGHKWAGVIHDPTVTWLATWKENVNDNIKYVFLAANSSLKGLSDMKKFDKARELKKHISKIRNDYQTNLRHKNTATRQMATAMYLIDRLALRAGNEKDINEEADTVGCCSLRPEHVNLIPPNTVTFDFLGKDSIRYINTVEVEDQVFRNLTIFMKGKDEPDDLIFDRINTQELNKHLSSYMKGLTAKVFRTFNASYTFQTQLKELTKEDSSIAEKVFAYNQANRQVAILCNHQRSVSKAHGNQMSKIEDKIKALKYQRMKLKKSILALEPRLKKKRSDLLEEESDLDEEWIIEYEKQLMEKEREKVRKKFEKDNEKLKEERQKPKSEKELRALLQEIDQKEKELAKERISGRVEPKKGLTVEKADERIQNLTAKIKETKLLKDDKESNKTTALGTSKINYIDPRISAAWCLKYKVPFEKIFNKSLRDKFKWAMDVVDADWEF
ncbi:DNA topoisomerase 1 [Gigaspora margarita]|uniref:DNA topoisomerase I n=1 Tax=Gigaspora margarita TaxID=4874 RepID=A0A8H3XBM6_GIGMA|nr:DNA topoisomerase 1 [Gigaspora margarita]